jgi:mannose-6-phosphate isomerase-like protein (cupin superfamily)
VDSTNSSSTAFTAAVVIAFLAAAWALPQDAMPKKTMSYHSDIVTLALENGDFRRVLFTGPKSQLVLMSIPPGGEAGEETHLRTEQTLFFVSGSGAGLLDGETFPIEPGTVVVVTPGTRHNFRNTGPEDLKLYTVYAPPNHLKERVQHTKDDADADTADEAFGEATP